ncbi:MAG TPA: hypothetical protein PKM25_06325 [Candidatus Ozemobacteraceae bacterium]|nr:hypothetical protein [Candidatus Ozemobacteraceae bacterium]
MKSSFAGAFWLFGEQPNHTMTREEAAQPGCRRRTPTPFHRKAPRLEVPVLIERNQAIALARVML